MANQEDAAERELNELLAGLSEAPAEQNAIDESSLGGEATSKPTAETVTKETVEDRISSFDEMAESLEDLLSSSAATPGESGAPASTAEPASAGLDEMEDAMLSALSQPAQRQASRAVSEPADIEDIEEVWDEDADVEPASDVMSVVPGADFQFDFQSEKDKDTPSLDDLVVLEPEKPHVARQRRYAKLFMGVAAAIALAALIFFFGVQPLLAHIYFKRLIESERLKNYYDAEQHLVKVQSFGIDVGDYFELSDVALETQDPARSLKYILMGLDLDPYNVQGLNREAYIYLSQGRLDDANDRAQQTLALDINNQRGYILLAQIALMRGDELRAKKHLTDVLMRNSKYVPALEMLRDIYVHDGNYKKAIHIQQELTSLNRDIPEHQRLTDLGKIYFVARNFAMAQSVLKLAFDKNPESWEASHFLTKAYVAGGLYRMALAQAEMTLKLADNPSLDMLYLRAISNYRLGNLREALEELQQIRNINPKYAPIHELLGEIYSTTYSRPDVAVKYYDRAVRYGSQSEQTVQALGEAQFRLGNYAAALEVWKPLMAEEEDYKISTTLKIKVAAAHIHVGQIENLREANRILTGLMRHGHRTPDVINNLAIVHARTDQQAQAMQMFFEAADIATRDDRTAGLSVIPRQNLNMMMDKNNSVEKLHVMVMD